MCSCLKYAVVVNWLNWGFCVNQKMDCRSIVNFLSLSMSFSLSLSIFLSLGKGTHYKNDKFNFKLIFIMAVMTCLWSSSAPPPIEDVSLMVHHWFLSWENFIYIISDFIDDWAALQWDPTVFVPWSQLQCYKALWMHSTLWERL